MRVRRLAKIGWRKVASAWIVVALGSTAQSGQATPPIDVTVCVTGAHSIPSSIYRAAKNTARAIFARIGIHIIILDCAAATSAATSPVVIRMRIVRAPMANSSTTALASALPFAKEDKTMTVSWDRIHRIAGGSSLEPHLLAYVIAHEIGHALQETDWHAQAGVMKASWNDRDCAAMQKGLLGFTSADIYMIREGLKAMKARRRVQSDASAR